MLMGLLSSLLIYCTVSAQQGDMSTVILLPDTAWLNNHGFVEEKTLAGTVVKCYKYADALSKNLEMSDAFKAVRYQIQEYGLTVIDREAIVNSPEANENISSLIDSLHPGIRVCIDFSVKANGPRKNITCSLAAYDVYCDQLLARNSKAVETMFNPISPALRQGFSGIVQDFFFQMNSYIQDFRGSGRMVNLRFTSDAAVDFGKDMVGGQLLKDYLYQVIGQYAVNGEVKKGLQQDHICELREVRIPFYDGEGEPLAPNRWAELVLGRLVKDSGLKIKREQRGTLGFIAFIVEK